MAAFGQARLGRLLLVQFVVSLLAAVSVMWLLGRTWFPVVNQAITRLPAQGEIRHGTLHWDGPSPVWLAENRWLALTVDLQHAGEVRSPADVEVEFGRNDFRVFSLFGFLQIPYPKGWTMAFNQPALGPWWGAWAPPVLALTAAFVILGLFASWTVLAALYSLPAWLLGFFTNKDLDLRGSWRLCGAALMPGALFMITAIVCYGLGILDLIKFLAVDAAHLAIGWVYLVLGTLAAPHHPQAAPAASNPFTSSG